MRLLFTSIMIAILATTACAVQESSGTVTAKKIIKSGRQWRYQITLHSGGEYRSVFVSSPDFRHCTVGSRYPECRT